MKSTCGSVTRQYTAVGGQGIGTLLVVVINTSLMTWDSMSLFGTAYALSKFAYDVEEQLM